MSSPEMSNEQNAVIGLITDESGPQEPSWTTMDTFERDPEVRIPHGIVDCSVEWYKKYSNSPEVLLKFDSSENTPQGCTSWLHKKYGQGLYIAEYNGWAHFNYHSGSPKKQSGYGGSKFTLNMVDGPAVELWGPWSSNAGAVNLYTEKKYREIVYYSPRSGCGMAGLALDVRIIAKLLATMCNEDVALAVIVQGSNTKYEPMLRRWRYPKSLWGLLPKEDSDTYWQDLPDRAPKFTW